MSMMPSIMYGFYLYFLLPVLALVLIGKPRLIIKLIHFILNIREPIKKIKIFMFFWFACGIYTGINLLEKFRLESDLQYLDKSIKNLDVFDTKMREINLCERNAFMYMNFFIIIIIIEKICESYFSFWKEEDKKIHLQGIIRLKEIKNKKD